MSNRRPNLWKPAEYERHDQDVLNQGYITCAKGNCVQIVGKPGDLCAGHKADFSRERSPRNIHTF